MLKNSIIDAKKILKRIDELSSLTEEKGVLTRTFLSSEMKKASDLVGAWMKEAGMSVRTDAIGNLIGRYEGDHPSLPALMLGSHLDTVRNAGKFDGQLGLVIPIACIEELNRSARRFPFALEIIAFVDEEGSRFQVPLLGSRAVAGTFALEWLKILDDDGLSIAEAIQHYGLDPSKIGSAARSKNDIAAYLEVHIEQGPILEKENIPIGVVTAINGATRLTIEITGEAGHAGTVPMSCRRDSLCASAECISTIEKICKNHPLVVGTVGKLSVSPGVSNSIPGNTVFSLDVRAPDNSIREIAIIEIEKSLEEICSRRQVTLNLNRTFDQKAIPCAAWIMDQMDQAIQKEGLQVKHLCSGAGHDGMAMSDLTDIAMLFTRCKGGISHKPEESISEEDIEISGQVLFNLIEEFKMK